MSLAPVASPVAGAFPPASERLGRIASPPGCVYRPRFETRRPGGGVAGEGTYYDSQSGQHVPVHDERKIAAYLRGREGRDPRSAVSLADSAKALGASGSIMRLPRTLDGEGVIRLLEALDGGDNDESHTLLRLQPLHQSLLAREMKNTLRVPGNVSFCFEFTSENGNCTGGKAVASQIRAAVADGIKASVGIFDLTHYRDEDPIAVASNVASLIDAAAEVGGSISNVVLDPAAPSGGARDGDETARLCEELSYLDVAGPTVKSRMVVAALDGDQLEECLAIGISKYIVGDDDGGASLDMLRDAVEEQGKELIPNA